ncbi:MAG: nucleotide exchange factor GrpE [Bacteroidaceae bacterium]|nr:nucleotide exchange factor GrpE [Bacteroidaceae bacterium]
MKKADEIPVEAPESTAQEGQEVVEVDIADADTPADNPADEDEDTIILSDEEKYKLLADQLQAAQAEIAELKDKNLRQMAEFDNFRKRTIKEKAELILNGGEKVLTALLPVLDDLERALENIEKSSDVDTLREGVELISTKLYKTLETQGLSRIDTTDQEFNTDFHEAIALVPTDEPEKKGRVIDCVQTGYKLGDKVIRHAKVAVGQ